MILWWDLQMETKFTFTNLNTHPFFTVVFVRIQPKVCQQISLHTQQLWQQTILPLVISCNAGSLDTLVKLFVGCKVEFFLFTMTTEAFATPALTWAASSVASAYFSVMDFSPWKLVNWQSVQMGWQTIFVSQNDW